MLGRKTGAGLLAIGVGLAMFAEADATDATNADSSAVYAAAQTSLANGKITVEYDESGDITQLRMNPDGEETLTLSGETLSFADGAKIVVAQNGVSCISNAIARTGTLQLGALTNTPSWHTGVKLTANDYTVMFPDTRLDDISPISSDSSCSGNTGMTMGAKKYYPYWVSRDGDSMTVELQAFDDKFIKGVLLELKQIGDGVCGKVLKAGHFGTNNTNLLGFCMFGSTGFRPSTGNYDYSLTASDNGVSKGYGVVELTVGPRRETYDYDGNLLSDAYDTVVARDVRLEDVEILYALGCNHKSLKGFPRFAMKPHHVKLENGVLSAQMFNLGDAYTKCVKIELRQSGSDVVARVAYAKYMKDHAEEYDFDVTGIDYTVATEENYTSNLYGYGTDMLALRRKSRNRLVLPTHDLRTISYPLSGKGMEVTFDAGASSLAADASGTTRVNPALYGTTYTTLTTEYALKDITVTAGRIGGSWCNNATGRNSLVVDWRNNGRTASCQIHAKDGESVKGVDVELRQNGGTVEIRCKQAVYHATKASEYYGIKRVVPGTDDATTQTLATSATGKAYALLWLDYSVTPASYNIVDMKAANTMTDSAFVIRGDAARALECYVAHANALPKGATECYGDSGLHIAVTALFNNGISNGGSEITMHPGSRLYQSGAQSFRCVGQKVTLDAATLYALYETTDVSYANELSLLNGSHVSGGRLQVGYTFSPYPTWTIAGAGAVTNDADLVVFSLNKDSRDGSARRIVFDVEDTVPGPDVDFVMNGDIANDMSYYCAAFDKAGPGTMEMNGGISCTNLSAKVSGGKLVLNRSGITAAGASFLLAGGALELAAGTTNAVAGVTLEGAAALSVGVGAALEMASLSMPDGATLEIGFGDGIDARALKVSETLSAEVLSRISLDGRRAAQSGSGYLCVGGFIISVR